MQLQEDVHPVLQDGVSPSVSDGVSPLLQGHAAEQRDTFLAAQLSLKPFPCLCCSKHFMALLVEGLELFFCSLP